MSERITIKHVESKVAIVNSLLGFENPDFRTEGTVDLDRAYGGTQVILYTSQGGQTTIKHGYGTLREAANFLDGMRQTLYILKER